VRIDASGVVTINGTVTANGGVGVTGNYSAGGGSGGAIYMTCASLIGDASGIIRVNGGSAGVGAMATGGRGGGGRIAVWIKVPDSQREQYLAGNTNRAFRDTMPPSSYMGAASVTNGTGAGVADLGTVFFFTGLPQGSVFMIR
jgi:predicted outer membrane repeat protein